MSIIYFIKQNIIRKQANKKKGVFTQERDDHFAIIFITINKKFSGDNAKIKTSITEKKYII